MPQLGEVQLPVDLNQQVVGINEVPQLPGGELEQSGIPAATIQWLEHHLSSDNDNVFINETLIKYCAERGIEFTRSRPYRKKDQAWIEQKNGSVVRHFVGHDRYSGSLAGQTMALLYGAVRQ